MPHPANSETCPAGEGIKMHLLGVYAVTVPSSAHATWFGLRHQRVAALDAVRATCVPSSIEQQQIDWSILIRVAAEFQAFCVDIHGLVADELVSNTATQNASLEVILRAALRPIHLSVGNPTSEKIKKDFARLGVPEVWNLAGSDSVAAKAKLPTLGLLMKIRNGVAHGQYSEAAKHLPARQSMYDFVHVKCMPDLDHIVTELDYALSAFIDGLFGLGRPW